MPKSFKRKSHSKNQVKDQERNSNGTFGTKKTKNDSSIEANDDNISWEDVEQIESNDSFREEVLDNQVEWGDDDDDDDMMMMMMMMMIVIEKKTI